MPDFNMLSDLPRGTLEGGISLLNKYAWNISIQDRGEKWLVFGGHKLLFSATSKAEVDSFLYGMSLVVSLLPPKVSQALEEFVRESTS